MNDWVLIQSLVVAVSSGTPVVLAGTGAILTQRGYSDDQVTDILSSNALRFLAAHLPAATTADSAVLP